MRRRLTVLAAALSAVALPAPALAADGVHVDPQSPAGVEYALPLDSARQTHGGGGAGSGGSGQSALFGSGLTSKRTTGTAPTAGSGSSTAASRRTGKPASKGDAGRAPRRSVAVSAPAAGDSASGALLALIAAIVLAGGGLGFVARRRLAPR